MTFLFLGTSAAEGAAGILRGRGQNGHAKAEPSCGCTGPGFLDPGRDVLRERARASGRPDDAGRPRRLRVDPRPDEGARSQGGRRGGRAKTYVPVWKMDEYYLFASGGQSGNVDVIGVPSMRLLKVIGVFTPESWPERRLRGRDGQGDRRWQSGDTCPALGRRPPPNLSETKGDYDGKYLFVNDKANARVAVVDLTDFATKQNRRQPAPCSDHGGAFVTPNTTT